MRAGGGRIVARAVLPTCVPQDNVFTAAVASGGAATALVRVRWGAGLCRSACDPGRLRILHKRSHVLRLAGGLCRACWQA